MVFKSSDIKKLGKLFGIQPKVKGPNCRFEIKGNDVSRQLVLELYSQIPIGSRRGNLISVYTPAAHLQLHFCSGYVISAMLGEVTFVSEHNGKLSGLTIEKEGGCSLYANVDRSLLSGDFTQLGPEVMLSGISLSLTDTILDGPVKRTRRKPSRRTKR